MSYFKRDVTHAEERIRRECPGAMLARLDYGFSLVAAVDGFTIIVFQPRRDHWRQPEIVADLDDVIDTLNGQRFANQLIPVVSRPERVATSEAALPKTKKATTRRSGTAARTIKRKTTARRKTTGRGTR